MRSEAMHREFEALLLRLQPTEAALSAFHTAFRAAWQRYNRDSEKTIAQARQAHEAVGTKKNMLFELLYRGGCKQRAFDEQLKRLEQIEHDAELELARLEGDQYDVEGILEFATEIAKQPALLWKQSPLEQQQRLQHVFFPSGVGFEDKSFGTTPSDSFFKLFSSFDGEEVDLASPTGFEPVLPP